MEEFLKDLKTYPVADIYCLANKYQIQGTFEQILRQIAEKHLNLVHERHGEMKINEVVKQYHEIRSIYVRSRESLPPEVLDVIDQNIDFTLNLHHGESRMVLSELSNEPAILYKQELQREINTQSSTEGLSKYHLDVMIVAIALLFIYHSTLLVMDAREKVVDIQTQLASSIPIVGVLGVAARDAVVIVANQLGSYGNTLLNFWNGYGPEHLTLAQAEVQLETSRQYQTSAIALGGSVIFHQLLRGRVLYKIFLLLKNLLLMLYRPVEKLGAIVDEINERETMMAAANTFDIVLRREK